MAALQSWFHVTILMCSCSALRSRVSFPGQCIYEVRNTGPNKVYRHHTCCSAPRFRAVQMSSWVISYYLLWQCKYLFRVRKAVCIEVDEATREIHRAIPSAWYWVGSIGWVVYTPPRIHLLHAQLKTGNQWCKWPAVLSLLHQERRPRLQPATTTRRHSAQALRLGQVPGYDMAPKPSELPADTLSSWPWVEYWGRQADS